eukprot:14146323-Alexandrium_andersonii.AAC.1
MHATDNEITAVPVRLQPACNLAANLTAWNLPATWKLRAAARGSLRCWLLSWLQSCRGCCCGCRGCR